MVVKYYTYMCEKVGMVRGGQEKRWTINITELNNAIFTDIFMNLI